MAHLITGHAGTEHIMPSDDGAFNAGVLGTGKYVLDLGNKFAHEIVSNNLVKIVDGELVNQGRHMNIPLNNYEEVTIENGLQGVKRYDLICMRYTKNADTSIESASLVVVKGTSSVNPTDPVCEEGNILEGALVDDFPLYRVRLDGLNIEGVDCLFEAIPSLATVNAKAEQNAEDIKLLDQSKENKLLHSYLTFSAVANPMQSAQSGWTHYAAITIDYSSLGNAEILQTSLIMLGDDTTQNQQNLPTTVAMSAMAMNGNKISRVGAFTNAQKTIRFGISVMYRNK